MEIDVYIPELKVGIEYCGLYWHCEKNLEDRNYHYNKYKLCKDNGIQLITIFEDEWENEKENIKSYIIKNVFKSNVINNKKHIQDNRFPISQNNLKLYREVKIEKPSVYKKLRDKYNIWDCGRTVYELIDIV